MYLTTHSIYNIVNLMFGPIAYVIKIILDILWKVYSKN